MARASFVVVGVNDANGRTRLEPRGGPPGFVVPLGDDAVALPGTLKGSAVGPVSLLFLAPGATSYLRIDGQASVTGDGAVLRLLTGTGKPPEAAIVVEVDEAVVEAGGALLDARLGEPEAGAEDQRPVGDVADKTIEAGFLSGLY